MELSETAVRDRLAALLLTGNANVRPAGMWGRKCANADGGARREGAGFDSAWKPLPVPVALALVA